MRRQPKGIPAGGEFASENHGGGVSDLAEWGGVEWPDPDTLRDTPNNRSALAWTAREIALRSNREPWADADEPHEFLTGLGYRDPDAAIRLCDTVYDEGYSPGMPGLDAPGLENVLDTDHDADWLARRASTGYRPDMDLLRFGDDGNLESLDWGTFEQEAWDMREDIIDKARDLDLDLSPDEIVFD